MPDPIANENFPEATIVRKKKGRVSIVWIVPIFAAVVAVGIAVQRIMSEGPTITIIFKSAQGVEAGKTFVKYKDVNIGQVTKSSSHPTTKTSSSRPRSTKAQPGLLSKTRSSGWSSR